MTKNHDERERGATAVLVAGALVFLFGAAALAVDTSAFYGAARIDQTTADLSCLAGVIEDTNADRVTMAAEFTKQNWKTMQGQSVTFLSGSTGTISDGANQVFFEASYQGDPDRMRVTVTEAADANFARVLGASSVNVVQQAVCIRTTGAGGGGVLPFGAVTGGWTGPLQINPPCGPASGNCGALAIPRSDTSGAGPTLIKNIAEGSDRLLEAWLGNRAGSVNCSAVTAGGTCHVVATDTGVSAAHLGNGFFDRLNNDPGATCTFNYRGGTLNCDTPSQILGGTWTPLMTAHPTRPAFWDQALYGAYNAANTNNHFWYNGVVAKCDSPRFAGVPIISENLDWDLGSAHEAWPNGTKPVKIVGFVDVIVEQPYSASDFTGNKNLKTAGASVIWMGPNATCSDGSPIGILNGVPVSASNNSVKLVAG